MQPFAPIEITTTFETSFIELNCLVQSPNNTKLQHFRKPTSILLCFTQYEAIVLSHTHTHTHTRYVKTAQNISCDIKISNSYRIALRCFQQYEDTTESTILKACFAILGLCFTFFLVIARSTFFESQGYPRSWQVFFGLMTQSQYKCSFSIYYYFLFQSQGHNVLDSTFFDSLTAYTKQHL